METFENVIIWIQNLPLSTWMREAFLPFPTILSAHIVGMALAAGTAILTGLRLMGAGKAIPPAQLLKFAPVAWTGYILAIVSGVLLFMTYPAKAVTNVPFFPKLAVLILGMVLASKLRRNAAKHDGPLPGSYRLGGLILILAFVFVIAAGRLLGYTYSTDNLLWYPRPPGWIGD